MCRLFNLSATPMAYSLHHVNKVMPQTILAATQRPRRLGKSRETRCCLQCRTGRDAQDDERHEQQSS
jgi:hypothetical protein